MSKTYMEKYKETIEKIKSVCNGNIMRIDRLCASGIAKQTDYSESYVYRLILEIINESEEK